MKYILINRKGITLVELIIALSLVGVMTIVLYFILLFGNKVFKIDNEQYEIQEKLRFTVDAMLEDVKYAKELRVLSVTDMIDEKASSSYDYFYIQNSSVYQSVYDGANRKETELVSDIEEERSFFAKVDGKQDVFRVKLTSQAASQNYQIDTEVKLINFRLIDPVPVVEGESKEKAIRYLP